MEEKKSKVILHGMWASTYSKRVEIALKLKGISYEYVEEDLKNKTESLIQLNPVRLFSRRFLFLSMMVIQWLIHK